MLEQNLENNHETAVLIDAWVSFCFRGFSSFGKVMSDQCWRSCCTWSDGKTNNNNRKIPAINTTITNQTPTPDISAPPTTPSKPRSGHRQPNYPTPTSTPTLPTNSITTRHRHQHQHNTNATITINTLEGQNHPHHHHYPYHHHHHKRQYQHKKKLTILHSPCPPDLHRWPPRRKRVYLPVERRRPPPRIGHCRPGGGGSPTCCNIVINTTVSEDGFSVRKEIKNGKRKESGGLSIVAHLDYYYYGGP